ncbi:MAG: SGNH/GDSL hydrolase family protein [Verrucomicrobiales bacterium]|nr:SGNH/GDSL hydrolase family protein [Verrucomicrobiales bacterium]
MIRSLCLALTTLCFLPAWGETLVKPASFFQLQDGDTVVFLGDSITHQSLYTQYIEDFFYTRFPERRIHFHNAGVSGDKAADALARFEDDVAAMEPEHITILLGMNDGQYEPFSPDTFSTYRDGMSGILTAIEKLNSHAIPLSPTMFDHHQLALRQVDETYRFRERAFDPGYNSLMAYYSAWLRETAGRERLPFVNLWGPLNDFTFAARRANPDFSLVEDAIHPGAAGHFIMANSIIESSLPERRGVSSITIMPKGDGWISSRNEEITDLKVSEKADSVSFTFLAKALPWVVPERSSKYDLKWGPSAPASLGYELTKAGHKLSGERFRVDGLAPGNYELTIDDTVIATFTSLQLGSKVELQKYRHTPQSQQALSVAIINQNRNDEAIRPMRDLWSKVKGLRRNSSPGKFAAEYPAIKEKIDALHARAREFEEKIYEANQPVPRRYLLRKVPADE